jgi:hypothetical protein
MLNQINELDFPAFLLDDQLADALAGRDVTPHIYDNIKEARKVLKDPAATGPF